MGWAGYDSQVSGVEGCGELGCRVARACKD